MGADIIIPAERVLNTALMRQGVTALAEVPVKDAYGTPLCYVDMHVRVQRDSGFAISHRGYHAGPDTTSVEYFTRVTRDAHGAAN